MTTLWIGPVFKQRARLDTFHGYGVQDFLEVDPRECWDECFAASQQTLASAGVGALAMQAAFIPTRHGTNAYTDELF